MKIGSRVKFPYGRSRKIKSGEVINVLPDGMLEVMHGTNFTMVDPEIVTETLPSKRRIKYIPFFEKGGTIKKAQDKWRKVYREYLDGELTHGTTGDKVTDKDMAMAIAYSEARKIYPMYNIYSNGGSPTNAFEEICIMPAPNVPGNLFAEQVYDFNMKSGGKAYQGSIELPSSEKEVAYVTWDKNKPEDWQNLEATLTNRAYQYADNKFGIGGFVAGTAIGAYLGFKTGVMMEKNDDPFKTERKIAKKTKEVAGKVSQKVKDRKGKKKRTNQEQVTEFKKGGVVTWKDKYNKKYGYRKGSSHSLEDISKTTKISLDGLQQIYNKGVGAFKTNPESVRPSVTSKEQWGMGRVYSAVMGGKSAKIDAKELKMKTGGQVDLFAPSNEKQLTVLSFGGGQDSTALFYMYLFDKEFREKYAPGDFVMVMANTGNEYPETYKHIEEIKKLAKQHGITFAFLEDYKYTTDSWKGGVLDKMRRNQFIMSVNTKSCTIALKIQPIYKWLDEYVCENYPELSAPKPCEDTNGKKALQIFAKTYGKINVILGIAKGEENRVAKSEDAGDLWFKKSIKRVYPLIDMGIDRAGAQEIIAKSGHSVPPPSNCMVCPYQNDEEILLLSLKYPNMFDKWTDLEKSKLDRFANEMEKQKDLTNLSLDTPIKYKIGDESITGYISGVDKGDGETKYEVTRTGSFRVKKSKKKDNDLIFEEAKKTGLVFNHDTKALDLVIPLAEQLQIYVSNNDTPGKVKPKLISRINYLNSIDRISPDQIVRIINKQNLGVKMDSDTLPEKVEIIKNKPRIIEEYKKPDGSWDIEKLEKYRFSHGHCGVKGAFKYGGTVDIDKMGNQDKIYIRVVNKLGSHTIVTIKPLKERKFNANVVVYGFTSEDPNELTIVESKSEIINQSEKDQLLQTIKDEHMILESTTF